MGKDGRLDINYKEEAMDTMSYAKWFRHFAFLASFVFVYAWLEIFGVVLSSEEEVVLSS